MVILANYIIILCLKALVLSRVFFSVKFQPGADQSRIMQEQMSGAAMAMPADTNKAFKVNWAVFAVWGGDLHLCSRLL